jgi:RimJ/RimL family protein N-acetyltransferase
MTTPGIVEHMMGPPDFPEIPVPSFDEFCADWEEHHWTHVEPERGRMFIAAADGELVGCIAQNEVVTTGDGARAVEIDLWLADPQLIGRGYGRKAILALCDRVRLELGVEEALLQPSARNAIARRSYAAAGFLPSLLWPAAAAGHYRTQPDYADSVFMTRRL